MMKRSNKLLMAILVIVTSRSSAQERSRSNIFSSDPINVEEFGAPPATSTVLLYDCTATHRPKSDNPSAFQVFHNNDWWTQLCQEGLRWNQSLCRCEYPNGRRPDIECREHRPTSTEPSGKYEQFVNGNWIVRDCSLAVAGLVWDQDSCQCVWGPRSKEMITGQGITPCDIMLNITFEDGLKDSAKNSFVEVGRGPVVPTFDLDPKEAVDGVKAAFFSETALNIWYFAGNELGTSLRVEFRFKMTNDPANRDKYQIFISNGCNVSNPGYTTPSLAIGYRPADQSYLLAFETSSARKAIVCTKRLGAYSWHTVSLIYEDGTLLLRVDDQPCIISQDFTGPIQKTPCPLTIGADPLERQSMYKGYLDNILIARYCRRYIDSDPADVEKKGPMPVEAAPSVLPVSRAPETKTTEEQVTDSGRTGNEVKRAVSNSKYSPVVGEKPSSRKVRPVARVQEKSKTVSAGQSVPNLSTYKTLFSNSRQPSLPETEHGESSVSNVHGKSASNGKSKSKELTPGRPVSVDIVNGHERNGYEKRGQDKTGRFQPEQTQDSSSQSSQESDETENIFLDQGKTFSSSNENTEQASLFALHRPDINDNRGYDESTLDLQASENGGNSDEKRRNPNLENSQEKPAKVETEYDYTNDETNVSEVDERKKPVQNVRLDDEDKDISNEKESFVVEEPVDLNSERMVGGVYQHKNVLEPNNGRRGKDRQDTTKTKKRPGQFTGPKVNGMRVTNSQTQDNRGRLESGKYRSTEGDVSYDVGRKRGDIQVNTGNHLSTDVYGRPSVVSDRRLIVDIFEAPANFDILNQPSNFDISDRPAKIDIFESPADFDVSDKPANLDVSDKQANLDVSDKPANLDVSHLDRPAGLAPPAAVVTPDRIPKAKKPNIRFPKKVNRNHSSKDKATPSESPRDGNKKTKQGGKSNKNNKIISNGNDAAKKGPETRIQGGASEQPNPERFIEGSEVLHKTNQHTPKQNLEYGAINNHEDPQEDGESFVSHVRHEGLDRPRLKDGTAQPSPGGLAHNEGMPQNIKSTAKDSTTKKDGASRQNVPQHKKVAAHFIKGTPRNGKKKNNWYDNKSTIDNNRQAQGNTLVYERSDNGREAHKPVDHVNLETDLRYRHKSEQLQITKTLEPENIGQPLQNTNILSVSNVLPSTGVLRKDEDTNDQNRPSNHGQQLRSQKVARANPHMRYNVNQSKYPKQTTKDSPVDGFNQEVNSHHHTAEDVTPEDPTSQEGPEASSYEDRNKDVSVDEMTNSPSWIRANHNPRISEHQKPIRNSQSKRKSTIPVESEPYNIAKILKGIKKPDVNNSTALNKTLELNNLKEDKPDYNETRALKLIDLIADTMSQTPNFGNITHQADNNQDILSQLLKNASDLITIDDVISWYDKEFTKIFPQSNGGKDQEIQHDNLELDQVKLPKSENVVKHPTAELPKNKTEELTKIPSVVQRNKQSKLEVDKNTKAEIPKSPGLELKKEAELELSRMSTVEPVTKRTNEVNQTKSSTDVSGISVTKNFTATKTNNLDL